jgi:hypothetical protein
MKELIEKIRKYNVTPYIRESFESEDAIHRISVDELESLLSTASEYHYFTDDDAVMGGVIETVAEHFGKLLPEDNDYDMRDYWAFFFSCDKGEYEVFFLDFWPLATE